MKKYSFIKSSEVDVPVEDLFTWHGRSGALMRLNPPWEKVKVDSQSGIEKGAVTDMKVYTGPIGVRWIADHTEYIENELFIDQQRKGPFPYWEHAHEFESIDENRSKMTDRIHYRLPLSILGDIFAAPFIRHKVDKMFRYRHEVTRNDLADYQRYKNNHQNIVMSGASGVLGDYLTSYLKTQGHNVVSMVRKGKDDSNIAWNTENGAFSSCLSCSDVVLHLAGEPIGEGKWTDDKKRSIVRSRVEGTRQIAEQIAKLKRPPHTLICASAIGFYGDQGDQDLTESDFKGDDFISEVCDAWEKAAAPAIEAGIRVVFLRIGVVLTPTGGALNKLMLPFQLGAGFTIGSGKQYISWILPDDVAGIIQHVISHTEINGAVNVTTPNPVTHSELSINLAKVLKRPLWFRIPEWLILKVFGQMGKETLLSSAKVLPSILIKTGYNFKYPTLYEALSHITGVYKK